MSRQLRPTLLSTFRGVRSVIRLLHRVDDEWAEPSSARRPDTPAAARHAPAESSGSAQPRSRSKALSRTIAILIMSAAVPWIGMLIAARSAWLRIC